MNWFRGLLNWSNSSTMRNVVFILIFVPVVSLIGQYFGDWEKFLVSPWPYMNCILGVTVVYAVLAWYGPRGEKMIPAQGKDLRITIAALQLFVALYVAYDWFPEHTNWKEPGVLMVLVGGIPLFSAYWWLALKFRAVQNTNAYIILGGLVFGVLVAADMLFSMPYMKALNWAQLVVLFFAGIVYGYKFGSKKMDPELVEKRAGG